MTTRATPGGSRPVHEFRYYAHVPAETTETNDFYTNGCSTEAANKEAAQDQLWCAVVNVSSRGNLGTKHVQEIVFQGCSHPAYSHLCPKFPGTIAAADQFLLGFMTQQHPGKKIYGAVGQLSA